jgi:hypothetical protein
MFCSFLLFSPLRGSVKCGVGKGRRIWRANVLRLIRYPFSDVEFAKNYTSTSISIRYKRGSPILVPKTQSDLHLRPIPEGSAINYIHRSNYGRGAGVGRGCDVGRALGVGLGLGVGVRLGVGVGVGVETSSQVSLK